MYCYTVVARGVVSIKESELFGPGGKVSSIAREE